METVELVVDASGGARFDKVLERIRDDLGFEHASFALVKPASGKAVVCTTYPDAWKAHYLEHGYQQIDPAVTSAMRATAPIDWSKLPKYTGYEEVFSAARDFHIPDQGLTIPIQGFLGEVGVLTVAADLSRRQWDLLVKDRITALQHQAAFLCDRTSATLSPMSELMRPRLSRAEKDALQWAGIGLPMDDIAGRMGISENLASIHISSARTKLRALTTPQAVGRAIMQKLISVV